MELLREIYPHTGRARVIGVTGSPGTGKSTLVDRLARAYREEGKKVGIIAVDPSSPFSGGAILGDRIRMQSLSSDPGVFIRSMATRGKLGGLSPAVHEALLILDAAGYEVLLVETVGVGQDEVEVVKVAPAVVVVLVPGMGDDIQTIKAGIMEIGDLLVINKADRDGAERLEEQLRAWLSIATREDGWSPPIVRTIATSGEGVAELRKEIERFQDFLSQSERARSRSLPFFRERLLELLRDRLMLQVMRKVPSQSLDRYVEKMMRRKMDPYTIVDRLIKEGGFKEEG